MDHTDLTDIYRTFHPNTTEYILIFSAVSGTFSKMDPILGHKTSVNKYTGKLKYSVVF